MAFKRSAVRSRLSPPKRPEIVRFQAFFFSVSQCMTGTLSRMDVTALLVESCLRWLISHIRNDGLITVVTGSGVDTRQINHLTGRSGRILNHAGYSCSGGLPGLLIGSGVGGSLDFGGAVTSRALLSFGLYSVCHLLFAKLLRNGVKRAGLMVGHRVYPSFLGLCMRRLHIGLFGRAI